VDAANHWDGCFSEATGQATTHGSVMTTTASKQTTALEQQLDSTARMRWEFWWLRHREDVELALAATPGQRAAGSLDTLQELLRLSQMGNASLSDVAVERHCCQHMGHQRFRTGQTVCTVGEIGVDAWFLVLSGGVRVTRHQPPPPESGRAPEPASLTLQPGDSFGELCATGESVEVRRCAVTAVAVDDCLLVAITHAIYRDVSHCQVSDKEFADALASMQSYRRGLWQRRRQGTATMPSHSLGASSSLTVAKLSPRRMLLLGQAPGEGVLGTLRPPRKGEIDFDTFRWWWTSQQDHRMRMKQEQREHVQGGPRSSRTGAVSPGHSVVVPGQGQLGTAPPMMKTAPPEESAKAPKARALRAAKRNEVLALLHGKDRRVRRQSRSRQLRVLQRLQERERPSTAVGTGSREELATREGHSTSRQSQSGQVELFRNRSEEEIATAWQMFSQQGRHASSLADSSPRQSMSSHHSQQLLGVSVGAAAFDQSSLTLEEQMRPSTALGLLPPHGHGGSGAVVAPMSSSAAWPPRLGQRQVRRRRRRRRRLLPPTRSPTDHTTRLRPCVVDDSDVMACLLCCCAQSTFGEGTRTDVSVILRNRSQQGRQRRRQQQAREDQGTAATAQQHGWQGSAQLLVSTRLGAQSTSCQILDDYYRYPYSRPPPTPSKRRCVSPGSRRC
jgi:CRP-like cAMP-binding protein